MKELIFAFAISAILFSCGNKTEEQKKNSSDSVVISGQTKNQKTISSLPKTIDSNEVKNLRMIVEIKGDEILFRYKNTGTKEICVWSQTEGYGLTWNYVEITNASGRTSVIDFDPGIREKSGIPVSVLLKPGKEFEMKEDLGALVRFRLEQKQISPLGKGEYVLAVCYNSVKGPLDRVEGKDLQNEHWNGLLTVTNLTYVFKNKK